MFEIKTLSFALGGLLLEGYPAFAARCACAVALLAAAWLVRGLLHKKLYPRLVARPARFAATPLLLHSFTRPVEWIVRFTGLYLALLTLPWRSARLTAAFGVGYRASLTACVCVGLYGASGLATLLLRSCSEEVRANRTLSNLFEKLYRVVVMVLGGATVAQQLGLPVGSILAGAGLVGLTVSLAAQDTASNLFSGMALLLERPFSIGDWITVGGVEGTVEDMSFRSIRVRALDNSVYVITNSNVCASTINNGSSRTKRLCRFTLRIAYGATRAQLEQLMDELAAMLKASPYAYEESVFVRLTGFGEAGIELLLSAYLRTTDYNEFLRMQSELDLEILDIVQRCGVSFAVPARSVRLTQAPDGR